MHRTPFSLFLALLVACAPASPEPAPPSTPENGAAPRAPSPEPAVALDRPAAQAPAGQPCGPLECQRFDDPISAFAFVLAEAPLVLAVGEAHAQRGAPKVDSATKRFAEGLLPLLDGKASDLVLELMVADGNCGEDETKTVETQKPVVERQAESNQNEFVALGKAAEKLSIRPHVLTPRCEDYRAVAQAGPDGVAQMLTMIADLSDDLIRRILARNARLGKAEALVIAYGGAIHNDVAPAEGRESWSFGPRLVADTQGRYVELDLIVPEFIKDNETWRALRWYEHFDPAAAPTKATLFKTGEGSYTLIFPRTP